MWEKQDQKSQNVRYVPIQIENSQASTSTPIEMSKPSSRVRTVPVKLVSVQDSGSETPYRKPRMHTPVRPEIHTLVEAEDEPEVSYYYIMN